MNNKLRNTDSIIRLSKEKSKETKIRVDKIISEMAFKNENINFNIVSKKANVSKSWLYKNQEIRERIENLRGREINNIESRKHQKYNHSEAMLIKTLKTRIKELEIKNKLLNDQLQKLYGKLY